MVNNSSATMDLPNINKRGSELSEIINLPSLSLPPKHIILFVLKLKFKFYFCMFYVLHNEIQLSLLLVSLSYNIRILTFYSKIYLHLKLIDVSLY